MSFRVDSERGRRSERRQHFRHQYPLAERPMVVIAGKIFSILDISERGLRINTLPGMAFVEGATVDMTIRFAEREGLALSGTIVQMQDTHVGILLSGVIP